METKPNPKLKRKSSDNNNNPPVVSAFVFPILLASIGVSNKNKKKSQKTNSYHHKIQIRLLRKLHIDIMYIKYNHNYNYTLPVPILSLIPSLLASKCAEVVCKCAKFVGAASLYSLEMNQQIANDEETVKSLISGLAFRKMANTLLATCNAVLDLATTSSGRCRLLDCYALNCIIACFIQVSKSSVPPEVAILTKDNGREIVYKIGFKEDELFVLLMSAAITFINSCHIEQIERIPKGLFQPFWVYMKNLWKTTRTQILYGNNIKFKQQRCFPPSNITTNDLAESIFRLSINADEMTPFVPLDVIKRSIFGRNQSSFENFISNHWEDSPLLMKVSLKASHDQNDVLNSVRQCLNFDNAAPFNFSAILKNLMSCPPLASDDLDILNFLIEARSYLGFPMIYQQDIRVLKTSSDLSSETHFFMDSQVFYTQDALRCEEAFKEGHTIALRGMEFRFANIAAVVDGLAYLFGQPSAGANMYLTPPNSQGLARHYDDHCVFVCQLIGAKKWKVFPRLSLGLPRLYEPVDSLDEADEISNECNQFLLTEGDILYIPRGYLHEACTIMENEKPVEEVEFSLHLTLAIEVEAPFEWEGFAHIALHDWFQNQQRYTDSSPALLCHTLNVISLNLLHVAIKLIGDNNPTFRKACLLGSTEIALLSNGQDMVYQNQKTIFSYLIKTVDAKSSFTDALEIVTLSLTKNEDPFQKLRWLQNVDDDDEIFELQNWTIPTEKSFLLICNELKENAEASFMFLKSKFCNEVDFEEGVKCYIGILEKYKKVRKQYKNGMLSLHYN